MGSISFQATSMFGSLSDVVGTKSGLALNDQQLCGLLARDEYERFQKYLGLGDDDWVRIELVTYDEMVEFLLYSVGRLERPNNRLPSSGLRHKYKHDPSALEIAYKISGEFSDFLNATLADPDLKLDPRPFMRRCLKCYGRLGLDMADELITSFAVQLEIKSFPTVSE